jgi:hypothetical protein
MTRVALASALARLTIALAFVGMALGGVVAPGAASSQDRHAVYLPALRSAGAPPATPTPPTPTPPPGSRPVVEVSHDTARAASATIGPEGGTLEVAAADGTRYTLTVPPAALDFSETFTMTPALAASGLPFGRGLAGAVSIEPAGLGLYLPATLRIVPPGALSPAPLTVGFAYRGAGERFHLYPLAGPAEAGLQQAAEPVITLELIEIKPVGAGRGSQADIDALPSSEADLPDPQDQLEEQAARTMDRLDEYFTRYLVAELYESDVSAAEFDEALRLYDAWLYFVESYELMEEYSSQIELAKDLLTEAVQKHSATSAERCYSEKRPEEGFRLLRWVRSAPRLFSISELPNLIGKLRACLVFEVSMRTWITEDADHWGWRHDLHAEPFKLRWTEGMRASGSGLLTYDAVTWIGEPITGCTLSGSGAGSTFNAAGGSYGLSISPVSRTSPAVTMRLSYDPGTPVETKSIECDIAPGGTYKLQHWRDYYAQMHDYERSGAGFVAQATVVGAGSFEGWVYNHTGMGTQGLLQEETEIEIRHTPERP